MKQSSFTLCKFGDIYPNSNINYRRKIEPLTIHPVFNSSTQFFTLMFFMDNDSIEVQSKHFGTDQNILVLTQI